MITLQILTVVVTSYTMFALRTWTKLIYIASTEAFLNFELF